MSERGWRCDDCRMVHLRATFREVEVDEEIGRVGTLGGSSQAVYGTQTYRICNSCWAAVIERTREEDAWAPEPVTGDHDAEVFRQGWQAGHAAALAGEGT